MNQQRCGTFRAIAAATLFAVAGGLAHAAEEVKIGFLVKQPEAPWFQDEWKFADQVAKEKGFKLVKIGVPSGGEVLTAIDNLGAQHAQGFELNVISACVLGGVSLMGGRATISGCWSAC